MNQQNGIGGHCLCQAVRWAYQGKTTWNALCHCESCRRATSAPIVGFVGAHQQAFRWTGAAPARYASSPGVERLFCAQCGSPMALVADHYPGEIFLYAGTLDDPADYQPQMHVHYGEHLPWFPINNNLPKRSGSNEEAKS